MSSWREPAASASGFMSGCLIFQRPAICSMTSLESIRTLELGTRGVLVVELQPGDQAAVLGDVVGGDADALGPLGDDLAGDRVHQHGAVRRVAGVASRSPSASMTTEVCSAAIRCRTPRWTRIRLHTSQRITSWEGLRDHAQVGGVQLEAAPAAAAGTQGRGTDTALLPAELLVERHQVRGHVGGGDLAVVGDLGELLLDLAGDLGAAVGGGLDLVVDLGEPGGEGVELALGVLELLHHLELGVLGSPTRRSRETISCCIRSRSLGLVISPWSIRSWSRLRRALTCSTSASAFFCARVRSSTAILASRARSPPRCATGREPAAPRSAAGWRAGAAAGRAGSRAPGRPAASAVRRDRLSLLL